MSPIIRRRPEPAHRPNRVYARVDLVPDEAGEPVVMEPELVESSLFLDGGPGAADRLAGAISAWLSGGSSVPA